MAELLPLINRNYFIIFRGVVFVNITVVLIHILNLRIPIYSTWKLIIF